MNFSFLVLIIYLVILLFSVVIHEVSHGAVADYLGDPTARRRGRLTLNPLPHLDFWGSFVVPIFMIISFGFAVGWAKPVPYNPYNLNDQKYGSAKVGAAGPASNLLVALFFGLFSRTLPLTAQIKGSIISSALSQNWEALSGLISGSVLAALFLAFAVIVFLNILLAFFNLVPIPPLDGSKILFAFLPAGVSEQKKALLQQYGFIILIAFLLLGGLQFIFPLVINATGLLLGV